MKIIFVLIIIVAAFGYYKYQDQLNESVQGTNQPTYDLVLDIEKRTNSNGFIDIPFNILENEGVTIFAPLNCPSERAKKADKLTSQLKNWNIPVLRTDTYTINMNIDNLTNKQRAELNQFMNQVMNQPGPIVIVNSHVKSNPSLHDIVNEYDRQTKPVTP